MRRNGATWGSYLVDALKHRGSPHSDTPLSDAWFQPQSRAVYRQRSVTSSIALIQWNFELLLQGHVGVVTAACAILISYDV
jgi:hypothetical protein